MKSKLTTLGLQKSSLWLLSISPWKSPVGQGPGGQGEARKLVNIQGSPPPSSEAVHPKKIQSQPKKPGGLTI